MILSWREAWRIRGVKISGNSPDELSSFTPTQFRLVCSNEIRAISDFNSENIRRVMRNFNALDFYNDCFTTKHDITDETVILKHYLNV
jgi:hypothetical protein